MAKKGDKRRFPVLTGEDNLSVFLLRESEVPSSEAVFGWSRRVTSEDFRK